MNIYSNISYSICLVCKHKFQRNLKDHVSIVGQNVLQTGLEPELLIFPIHYSSFYYRDTATHLRLYTSERKVQQCFFPLSNIRCNCRFFQSQVSFLTPGHSLWNSVLLHQCVSTEHAFWFQIEFETYFLAWNDVNDGFVSMYRG